MKILLSAYSCEPGQGSERGVGWNVARTVARHHQVWVLTRPDEGKEVIEAELIRNPEPNLHFVYFNLPILGSMWKWGFGLMQLHYYLWQIQAYLVARQLHRKVNFDVAHHVTFVKYSRPSFISLLPIPFMWGPVGGAEQAPKTFWKDFNLRNKVFEIVRLIGCWVFEMDPFVRLTARRSAFTRATTQDTAIRVQKLGAKNVQIYTDAGLSNEEIAYLAKLPVADRTHTRFISTGRLLHWKGFHLGLRAFAQAHLQNAEYWIIGDGPERHRLQKLAEDLGISEQVKFWQKLPRQQVLQNLRTGTALIHPSLHDGGGWVCLEAMAAGLPVICLNLGGPVVQVTEETGFKVEANTPEQAVKDIADAMKQLTQNRELRDRMGNAAHQRISESFSWEAKAADLANLYHSLASQAIPHLQKLHLQETERAIPANKQ